MVRTLADLNNEGAGRPPNPMGGFQRGGANDWTKIPMFFYLYLIITLILFIVTMFIGVGVYLMNIPIFTIFKLQVWRVFLNYFVFTSIFSLIISLLVMYSLSTTEESERGTGRFILEIFYRNLAIQILFTAIGILGALFFDARMSSSGIWPVYFVFLTLRCLENPEGETTFCMLPCPIKNKYYPIFLLMIFTLLGGGNLDIWVGFGFAHLMRRSVIIQQYMTPSDGKSYWVERQLKRFDGQLGVLIPIKAGQPGMGGMTGGTTIGGDGAPGRSTEEIVRPAFAGQGVPIGGEPSNAIHQTYDPMSKTQNLQNPLNVENKANRDEPI
jgi:hypothetical protein